MRGAEFSPSAKRSKLQRRARAHGIQALTTSNEAALGNTEAIELDTDAAASARAQLASAAVSSAAVSSAAVSSAAVSSAAVSSAAVSSAAVSSAAVSTAAVSDPLGEARGQAGLAPGARVDEANLSRAIDVPRAPADPVPAQEPSMRQPSNPERSRPASSPLASVAPLGLSRNTARGELASAEVLLSDHVVFNDEKLARRYAAEPIPISTLYEAFFDGSLDIPGDLVEFLQSRNAFVKHTITRQHLQWAVTNFVPEMVAHSREADARSARELFDDRGDDFFRACLGDRMAFTCAHFDSPADSLENGVDQMNARICDKIGLRASHRVLEVGCGWGSFLAHVAASRGAECVGTTLSRAQEIQANRRFAELGIERQARSMLLDYRDLPPGTYDRIVCLETVERVGVKNLKGFFEKLREHLVDDGLFFLQWTGLRRKLQPEDLMWGLFINKHVFPGADAALPLSSMLKVAEKSGWEVQGVENVSRHYSQTLRLWRANWESHRVRIVAEHGERWFRIWQFFLAWSQIVAEQGNAACFQVVLNKNLDSLDRRALY
jgi:cyclopropane fatty-acyl-phospholipid synthase-like methyltransferase